MLEILQFYVSSFWTWAGITFGFLIVCGQAFRMAVAVARWLK